MRGDPSRITLCLSARVISALAAAVLAGLTLGACGGDDEPAESTTVETTPGWTPYAPVTTPPPETTVREDKPKDPDLEPRTVPQEEQEGDEEAIRSEAVFTGRDGRLTPRVIRVPAFIAIRVILRSPRADEDYRLTIGGEQLAIGHGRAVDEAKLAGLPPNKAYSGTSPQGGVRVVASAEPGP